MHYDPNDGDGFKGAPGFPRRDKMSKREELADEIDRKLDAYLGSLDGGQNQAVNEVALRNALWDNKAGIIGHLRAGSAATPSIDSHAMLSALDDASNACLELAAKHGYATGHGDTVADMIREFSAQIPAATPPTAWRVWWVSLNTARTKLFEEIDKAKAKARETGGCIIPLYATPAPLANCPICLQEGFKGIEGCDHTVTERARAATPPSHAATIEILSSFKIGDSTLRNILWAWHEPEYPGEQEVLAAQQFAEQQIERIAAAVSPSFDTNAEDRLIGDLIAKICSHSSVNEAMEIAWDDICTDTGCHPLDITHGKNKHLTFRPNHWADQIAKRLFVRALKLRLETDVALTRAERQEGQS